MSESRWTGYVNSVKPIVAHLSGSILPFYILLELNVACKTKQKTNYGI